MRTAKDISGHVFGRLTVISKAENSGRKVRWICKCVCGNETLVAGNHLRSGSTISCGCFAAESTKTRSFVHGKTKSTEYRSWIGMKQRCTNSRNAEFHRYGGRGISVCDRWLNSFENFIKDMGNKPEGKSIDRIDNNLGYSPENCRWATAEVQSNNKSNNRLYTIGNDSYSVIQWERITGTYRSTIQSRLKRGWDIKEAVYGEPVTNIKQISEYLVF